MRTQMRTHESRVWGHTRWKRLALVLLPTLAVSAILAFFVGIGVLPAALAVSAQSVVLSGRNVRISADRLQGTNFTQYVAADRTSTGTVPEGLSGVGSADLYNLCQSTVITLPGFGRATLLIGAGGGGNPAHADNLVVHTNDLSGDAVFHNILIGTDVSTVPGVSAPAGSFGQHADTVRIDHLRQSARGVTAGTFRLTGLHLHISSGDHSCR